MIDPLLEAHLWFLLVHERRETVTLEEICWFHSGRAVRIADEASLTPLPSGHFAVSARTAAWADSVFRFIRHDHTAELLHAAPGWLDYEPHDDVAAPEALPALAAYAATRAASEGPRGEPTPTEPHRLTA